jgi:histidine triad (HIT) family protein
MYDDKNIFAKILRKEIPCESIYEDDKVLFIHDIYPEAKIHILGIPKIPVVDFSDFMVQSNRNEIQHFFCKIHDLIKEFGIKDSGFKIIMNSGDHGGQEIPHFHVHILGGEKLKGVR